MEDHLMKRDFGRAWCVIAVAAALTASSARADMMSDCKADIASLCSGVSDGHGRLSACLFSQASRLDPTCKSAVETLARQDQSSMLLPAHVRNLMGSGSAPTVPAACSADEGRFCSGADAGSRNMLACLYAHSDSVSAVCASAIEAALN
jgi:hypothetical protein